MNFLAKIGAVIDGICPFFIGHRTAVFALFKIATLILGASGITVPPVVGTSLDVLTGVTAAAHLVRP